MENFKNFQIIILMDLCGKSNQNLQKNNNDAKKQPDQNQAKLQTLSMKK